MLLCTIMCRDLGVSFQLSGSVCDCAAPSGALFCQLYLLFILCVVPVFKCLPICTSNLQLLGIHLMLPMLQMHQSLHAQQLGACLAISMLRVTQGQASENSTLCSVNHPDCREAWPETT